MPVDSRIASLRRWNIIRTSESIRHDHTTSLLSFRPPFGPRSGPFRLGARRALATGDRHRLPPCRSLCARGRGQRRWPCPVARARGAEKRGMAPCARRSRRRYARRARLAVGAGQGRAPPVGPTLSSRPAARLAPPPDPCRRRQGRGCAVRARGSLALPRPRLRHVLRGRRTPPGQAGHERPVGSLRLPRRRWRSLSHSAMANMPTK